MTERLPALQGLCYTGDWRNNKQPSNIGSCHSALERTVSCCASRTWVALLRRATEMYLICFINTEPSDWLMLIICFATSQNARRGLSQETSQRVSFAVKTGSGCVSCYLNTVRLRSERFNRCRAVWEENHAREDGAVRAYTKRITPYTTREKSRTATECAVHTDILSYYYGHSAKCVVATHAANLIHSL